MKKNLRTITIEIPQNTQNAFQKKKKNVSLKTPSVYIDFYKNIGCIRGNRHKRNLPVRGQRTHTNAKTAKKKTKY